VLTERQRQILTHFSGKATFTSGECIELLSVAELHKDLENLVDIGVLRREAKGNAKYYRIAGYNQPKTLGELTRKNRVLYLGSTEK